MVAVLVNIDGSFVYTGQVVYEVLLMVDDYRFRWNKA
jgi:hypothetical protein